MFALAVHAPLSFAPTMAPVRSLRSAPVMQAEVEAEPYNPVTFAKSLPGIAHLC